MSYVFGSVCKSYGDCRWSVLLRKTYLISVLHLSYLFGARLNDRRLAASQNVRSLPASLARSFLITEEAFRFHGYGAAQRGDRATQPPPPLENHSYSEILTTFQATIVSGSRWNWLCSHKQQILVKSTNGTS